MRAAPTTPRHRHIFCGIGAIYSSPSFLLLRPGAPPPSVGLRERLEMCRVNFHRCGGLKTSNKCEHQIASTQQQQALPTAQHFCSACASGTNTTVHNGVYHIQAPIFDAPYLHRWNRVGANKVGFENISSGAFRSFTVRCWHPFGCRAIELGRAPQGR